MRLPKDHLRGSARTGQPIRNDPKGFPSLNKPLHCDRLVNYEIVTDYNPENNRIAA